MDAVLQIETSLGYQPKDVSAAKCGYDVESYVPEAMRQRLAAYALRMIEVKGRRKGATTVTVSKNEILTALNKPEEFILSHDLPETSVQECPGLYRNQCEL